MWWRRRPPARATTTFILYKYILFSGGILFVLSEYERSELYWKKNSSARRGC